MKMNMIGYQDVKNSLLKYRFLKQESRVDYEFLELNYNAALMTCAQMLFLMHKAGFITLERVYVLSGFKTYYVIGEEKRKKDFDRKKSAGRTLSVTSSGGGYNIQKQNFQPVSFPKEAEEPNADNLSQADIFSIARWASDHQYEMHLNHHTHFVINITPENRRVLANDFNPYIQAFIDQKIGSAKKFQSYQRQKELFFNYCNSVESEYGSKSLNVKAKDLWPDLASYQHSRFWELVFALEMEGKIKIHSFFENQMDSFIICDVLEGRSTTPDTSVDDLEQYLEKFINKAKSEMGALTVGSRHRQFRDKWLRTKRILDKLDNQTPLFDSDNLLLSLTGRLAPEELAYVEPLVREMDKLGIFSIEPATEDDRIIMSSTSMVRDYYSGKKIYLLNVAKFRKYLDRVTEFYQLVEQDGFQRFPANYGSQSHTKAVVVTKQEAVDSNSLLASWEELRLHFRNEQELVAYKGTKQIAVITCDDLDCKNRKTGLADVQWKFLQLLSLHDGEYDLNGLKSKDKLKYQQQKKRLTERLQKYFNMETDPFLPYKEGEKYKTKFTLTPETELSNGEDNYRRIQDEDGDSLGIAEGYRDATHT